MRLASGAAVRLRMKKARVMRSGLSPSLMSRSKVWSKGKNSCMAGMSFCRSASEMGAMVRSPWSRLRGL